MRKNIILLLALLVSGAACAGNDSQATANVEKESDIEITTAGVKPMTGEEFDKKFMYEGSVRERPAVIDFNASWCGPCRQLAPILEKLAEKYAGEVDFYSIDVDENPEVAAELGIRSIPYMVFAPSEGAPQTLTGLHDEVMLTGIIDQFLLGRINTDVDIKYRDGENDSDDEATRALKAKREEQEKKQLEDEAKKNAGKKGKKGKR